MRISQDVRAYASQKGVDDAAARQLGMVEKSAEFREEGARVYLSLVNELQHAVTSTAPADDAG